MPAVGGGNRPDKRGEIAKGGGARYHRSHPYCSHMTVDVDGLPTKIQTGQSGRKKARSTRRTASPPPPPRAHGACRSKEFNHIEVVLPPPHYYPDWAQYNCDAYAYDPRSTQAWTTHRGRFLMTEMRLKFLALNVWTVRGLHGGCAAA